VLNTPKRGIGKTTIERLTDASNQLGIPLWDVVSDAEAVRTLGGRSAKGLLQFCELINDLQGRAAEAPPSELVQRVMEQSGYLAELIATAPMKRKIAAATSTSWSTPPCNTRRRTMRAPWRISSPPPPWPAMPTARTPSRIASP